MCVAASDCVHWLESGRDVSGGWRWPPKGQDEMANDDGQDQVKDKTDRKRRRRRRRRRRRLSLGGGEGAVFVRDSIAVSYLMSAQVASHQQEARVYTGSLSSRYPQKNRAFLGGLILKRIWSLGTQYSIRLVIKSVRDEPVYRYRLNVFNCAHPQSLVGFGDNRALGR